MDITVPAVQVRPRPGLGRVLGRNAALGFLLVLPLVFVMVVLLAYPVLSALLLSFQDKTMGSPGVFIGLGNYDELLFRDTRFWQVERNSVAFTFI
jgi:multiple sugar transport system permease protein